MTAPTALRRPVINAETPPVSPCRSAVSAAGRPQCGDARSNLLSVGKSCRVSWRQQEEALGQSQSLPLTEERIYG